MPNAAAKTNANERLQFMTRPSRMRQAQRPRVEFIAMTTAAPEVPVAISDPVNARILAVSEDKIQGFHADPLGEIAKQSGVELDTVIERVAAMLRAGTIRRVRQTLLATSLARGALVAW